MVFLFYVDVDVSFSITILGSSGAMPVYGRHTSCQLVDAGGECFLIDCGEGAQMQLARYQMPVARIDHILISHLHGDHFLGLLGLIFTMHMNKRTNDLHLYSHPGLDEIITTQLRHTRSVPNFRIIFHPLHDRHPEVIMESKLVTVETIPLSHKIECTGFLIREKPKPYRINKEVMPPNMRIQDIATLKRGQDVRDENGSLRYARDAYTLPPRRSRSYAYCSDTQYHEPVCEQLMGVDVLYHESTFMEADQHKAVETRHSTAREAAMIAAKANVSQLLIGHYSARYKDLDPLLLEAQAVFANTHLAEEGKTFHIPE